MARLDNSYENYREIAASALLMYGGKGDTATLGMTADRLAGVLPQTETKIFPKLDHFGLDKSGPQAVARAVGDFFSN